MQPCAKPVRCGHVEWEDKNENDILLFPIFFCYKSANHNQGTMKHQRFYNLPKQPR
jgi:hypothetical protein